MTRPPPGRLGETLFWLVALLAALRFTDLHLVVRRQHELATLDRLIDGTAVAPFAERVLSPWLIGVVADTSGLGRYVVAAGIEVIALLALVWVFRAILLRHVPKPGFASPAALSLFVPLVVHFVAVEYFRLWYPYDIPAVLGVAAFWWALERRSWTAAYLIFALATLNRETTLFLAALPVLCFWDRLSVTRLLAHAAALVLIWLALKTGVHLLVAPDMLPFQVQLAGNIEALLARPLDALQIASVFAFAWIPVLAFNQLIPDSGLRRALLVVPAWFAAMTLVANLHEIRVFAELIPLVWLAACLLAARALGLVGETSERP